MFTPKILALGALTAGLIGVGLYSTRDFEIWMPKEEVFYRKVCTQLMEKNFPLSDVGNVYSYQNQALGYTITINTEHGPDLQTGWTKVPDVPWAAECVFGGSGKLLMIGVYHFEKDIHVIWSDTGGWLNLKDVWSGKKGDLGLSRNLQEV